MVDCVGFIFRVCFLSVILHLGYVLFTTSYSIPSYHYYLQMYPLSHPVPPKSPLTLRNTTYPVSSHTQFNKTLVYVIGIEGSGTTITSVMLAHIPHFEIGYQINKNRSWASNFSLSNHQLWNAESFTTYLTAKHEFFKQLKNSNFTSANKTHLVLHRSVPDFDNLHYIDLSPTFCNEIFNHGFDMKFIVLSRAPSSCCYSNYKRNFGHLRNQFGNPDLIKSCKSTEQFAIYLNQLLRSLPKSYFEVIHFANLFIEESDSEINKVLTLLNIPDKETVLKKLSLFWSLRKRKARDWQTELQKEHKQTELNFLHQFWDKERIQKIAT